MDMQAALRARLIAAAPVMAVFECDDRLAWVERPQPGAFPALTLQTISSPRPQHYRGFQGLRPTRVQLDSWATSYAAARAGAEAAISAIVPAHAGNGIRFGRAQVAAERDLGEDTPAGFIHRVSIDLIIWHQPA